MGGIWNNIIRSFKLQWEIKEHFIWEDNHVNNITIKLLFENEESIKSCLLLEKSNKSL